MKLLKAALVSCTMFLSISALLLAPASSLAGEAELKAEIDRLWSKVSQLGVGGGGEAGDAGNWSDKVTISGVVEVEVGVEDTVAETTSDIAVATVELGIEAEISDFSSASVLFLFEDGEDIAVDEATITIGNIEKMPLYLTAGKMYVPFGNYESQMISDPMTLELGEAQEDAILVGVEAGGFYGAVYLFNGDTMEGTEDEIEHFGLNAGFAMEQGEVSFDVGAGWISSIVDSDGLWGYFVDKFDPAPVPADTLGDFVEGYAVHVIVGAGPATFIGEYVAAADNVDAAIAGTEVSAYNVEVGISFPMGGEKEGSFAVGYQATDEGAALGAPEDVYLATFSMELMEGTGLAFEWRNAEDYAANGGGDTDTYTLQLAAEF